MTINDAKHKPQQQSRVNNVVTNVVSVIFLVLFCRHHQAAPALGVHSVGSAAVPAAPSVTCEDPRDTGWPSGDVAEDPAQGR
jgi:hypothetical protein